MESGKIIIKGGRRLTGKVRISGSKNAALPILAAAILIPEKITLTNLPSLLDIQTMLEVLNELGANSEIGVGEVIVNTAELNKYDAPYEQVRRMRASAVVMGALLARFGKAYVPMPGGCNIGSRPINIHLDGLSKLGAKISLEKGYVKLSARKLKGAEIYLDFPSVGATENLMMAACAAEGETIIDNAAKEPEITALADFLNKAGAEIQGAGSDIIKIKGVKELKTTTYRIIPDRIETGTYIMAAAITKGDILIEEAEFDHLHTVVTKLEEAGVIFEKKDSQMRVHLQKELSPVNIRTMPYPGFPTDLQAQFMALMCMTEGMSVIIESVFENRFMHVGELCRMGADIKVDNHTAIIRGIKSLSGTAVNATDLRASAALILAGLAAKGETQVSGIYHLDRGYEYLEEKLTKLGAQIKRIHSEKILLEEENYD
ncbi:MAG: UDP-N-acetylglucosamine 1-carboxyvinyltransferase [bacterium]|nr:UDP-N-acetylglucosamine 1-carboxyvinyltransferase [bacterium]